MRLKIVSRLGALGLIPDCSQDEQIISSFARLFKSGGSVQIIAKDNSRPVLIEFQSFVHNAEDIEKFDQLIMEEPDEIK